MKWKLAIFLICCLLIPNTSNGQEKNKKVIVKGTVTDELGAPLKGINIYVDNNKTSAITNKEGAYKVKVKPTIKIISAFSIEYGGQVVDFEGQTEISFTLTGELLPVGMEVEDEGEEVDIGYQKAKKESLTISVGEVNMDDASKSVYRDIYDMIRSKVPGVVVSGTSITIRGATSIYASNEPLFVVDGTPVSSIDYIDPNDVGSISVLKGSAAAIYGARGSNGVILINLKSGRQK